MFTISNIFKRGANYLFMVLLARTISVYDFGIYSIYVNVCGVILLLTNFGFSEYLLVNSKKTLQKKANLRVFVLISFSLFFLVFLGLFALDLEDSTIATLVLCKTFFETSMYNIMLSYYQVETKLKEMSKTNIWLGLTVIILSIIFYLNNKGVQTLLIAIVVSYILIFSHLFYKSRIKGINPRQAIRFIKNNFFELKFYGFSTITVPVYMMLPTLIGSFLLSPEDFAQYQVAFSIANILLLVSTSLLQEDYTVFLKFQENTYALKSQIITSGKKIISANLLILFIFVLFGEDALLFVYKKEEYLKAYPLLLMLLFSNMIFMIASVAASLMVVLKMQKTKAKYHIEFILAAFVFGTALTFKFGSGGLVLSYVLLYSYSAIRYSIKFRGIVNQINIKTHEKR